MRRIDILLVTATLACSAMACDNDAAREQQKATEAQREANEKAAEAKNTATTKITAAQVEADKKIVEANANFQKIREDYRHKVQKDFDEVNTDIAKLELKAKTATGKTKTDLEAQLLDIRSRRDAFRADLGALETANASAWDGMKERIDNQWTALKDSVRKAGN